MKLKLLTVVAAAAAAVIGGSVYYTRPPPHQQANLIVPPVLAIMAAGKEAPAAPAATKPASPPLEKMGLTSPKSIESMAIQFEVLAASPKVAERFKAYSMAYDCLWAHVSNQPARSRREGRPDAKAAGVDEKIFCGDMKPGQWDDPARRLPIVIDAVVAGEPRALSRLHAEAYNFRTIDPTSKQYKEAREQGYKAALERADPFALTEKAANEDDPALRLQYKVAAQAALVRLWGGDENSYNPALDPALARYRSAVPESARAGAEANGLRYVAQNFK